MRVHVGDTGKSLGRFPPVHWELVEGTDAGDAGNDGNEGVRGGHWGVPGTVPSSPLGSSERN